MKTAVITFPGSNCDRDMAVAIERVTGHAPLRVWHGDSSLPKVDLVVLPGGFSFGDYLRCGAMAAHSPIVREVAAHAARGGLLLGVCNGFQILTEAGLLPGVLLSNQKLKFICKNVHLRVETTDSAYTNAYAKGQVITIPVAHHDGNYFAQSDVLARLADEDRVAFRYVGADGSVSDEHNPNGSARNIAGILNEKRNVLGMMPHPERHVDPMTGGVDGVPLFKSVMASLQMA